MSAEDETKLCELLSEYHDVFSLEEDERGQTNLIEFSIDTVDDVLIFSRSVEEHIQHLRAVLECMRAAKLKPTKCKLLREEVEYLGHVITLNGLKPTTRHLNAVKVALQRKQEIAYSSNN